VLVACVLGVAAPAGEKFYRAQQAFANAHNDWVRVIKNLSPESPDYEQRVREEWLKRDIGQKFRKLEQSFE
jgi:hypothetical protein